MTSTALTVPCRACGPRRPFRPCHVPYRATRHAPMFSCAIFSSQIRAAEEEKARVLRKAEDSSRRLKREAEAEAAALEAEAEEARAARLRAAEELAEVVSFNAEEEAKKVYAVGRIAPAPDTWAHAYRVCS